MRHIFCLLLMLISLSLHAGTATVDGVRIWAAPDSTRLVLDIDRPVKHQLLHLTEPYRVVIDIDNARLSADIEQPDKEDKFLLGLRSGKQQNNGLRIVLDLKKHALTHSFLLKPNQKYGHRLVIDLDNKEQNETLPVVMQEEPVTSNTLRDVIIAIDAGHGGEDPGARGPSGTFEKTVVLKIAKKLAEKVNRQAGMKAVLIREGDYYLRLRNRIEKAREHRADLFVSIHADAFRDPRVHGSSVYVLSKRGASSEAAKWLAEQENASDLIGGVSLDDKDDILASVLLDLSQTASLEASIDVADRVLGGLKGLGKVHKKTVQSAGFAVLKSPDIPSILIETAYISNPKEERNLLDPKFQDRLAQSILNGLKGYFTDHGPKDTLLASLGPQKHIITHGETLSGIAQRYQVSLKSLREHNGLRSDRIMVGRSITIPNDS